MDRMARALGLGGINEADDEFCYNVNKNITQGQTAVAPAANDDSWNIVMAEQRGRNVAVIQTQETAEASRGHQTHPPPLGPQIGLPMAPTLIQTANQPPSPQEEFSGITTTMKMQGHQNYEIPVVAAELALQREIQGSTTK
jgi:hypothetical protein